MGVEEAPQPDQPGSALETYQVYDKAFSNFVDGIKRRRPEERGPHDPVEEETRLKEYRERRKAMFPRSVKKEPGGGGREREEGEVEFGFEHTATKFCAIIHIISHTVQKVMCPRPAV